MLLLSVFFSSRILKEFSYLSLNFIEHDDVILNCLMLKQWILSLSSKLVMFQPFKLKQVLLFQPVDLPPSEENRSTMVCSVFASHPSHLRENVGVPLPKKIPPTLETIFKWGVCKVFPDMWTYACRGIITICYLQQMQAAMGTRVACNWYTSIVKSWSISTTVPHQDLQWQPDKENVETLLTKNPGITKFSWTLPFRAPRSSKEVLFAIVTQSPTIVNKKMVLRVLICVWIFVSAVGEAVGEIVPAGLNMTLDDKLPIYWTLGIPATWSLSNLLFVVTLEMREWCRPCSRSSLLSDWQEAGCHWIKDVPEPQFGPVAPILLHSPWANDNTWCACLCISCPHKQ